MEVRRCPSCGEENPGRAKFCLQCGTQLAAEDPGVARESRRVVTVVFADMVGFTSLGERLDQESLRRVMDRFYAEMRAAIEGQGGTLAKFIGDAVLAVWGTPQVGEDDAVRAVRAAEAMRHALAGLNASLEAQWGVHVGMRTGVNTGEVVVDPTRPADLLVGDTLNVAARLEQAAADGEVLVGSETYRLVRDEAVLDPVEPLALKGKARPLAAWRLVDGSGRDERAAPRMQAPFVARDAELARLRAAFEETVATGSCRTVTVIGSPGLGKTRLVEELTRSLAGEATVLEGRCEATGEGMTFQPVAEVLRAAAGVEDEDTPQAARAKLRAVLPDDDDDRGRIVDRTAALLGLGPVASTEETFWAVRRLLEALARQRPVVLVHDDIHWGQPTFLDLLEHLGRWVRDAPLLILALARPELREVRPALAEPGVVVADVLALEPLAPDASRSLIDRLLGQSDLPEALARRVLETTDGNPLFLGETVRMLADEGVLRRQDERWVATGDAAGVTVPPTIQALLAARIERLADHERSVVERAAVIGHQFYRGAVAELAPASVKPRVDGALDTLRRKDLVLRDDAVWLDEDVFRFHHVLIRDAAYRSLLKEARAELHERFADWLEAKAGALLGEHEEVVGFHLEQAHRYRQELGPLDEHGRRLAARAAAHLHSAGRRALSREDLPAAVNLLGRALVPLDAADGERLEVLVDLAESLLSAGDTAAAEQVVEELGLGADEAGDDRLRAWATVCACQLDNLTGAADVDETAVAAAAAACTLGELGDHAGQAKADQVVAQAHALLGQVAAAEAALDRALVAARAADDRRRITAVLSGAPRAALWGPAPIVRASGRCLDVVRILRMTPGNRHVEAMALRCQAVLEAMRGRAEAARGILDTCRMTFEELGLAFELLETETHAGMVELLAGDPEAAERHLRTAQEGLEALGVAAAAGQSAALLARALLEQGREDEAIAATELAERRGGQDLKTTITWHGVRAEALARRGERDTALQLARHAAALAEPTDALADKADALMALAEVELMAGGGRAAARAAARARDLYEAKGHAIGMRKAEVLAGQEGRATTEAGPPAWAPRTPAEHVHAEFHARFRARDWQGLRELFADEFRQLSHRALSEDDARSPEEAVALMRSVAALGDIDVDYTPLAATDEVAAGMNLWSGNTPDGTEAELAQRSLVVNVGGRMTYAELFDSADATGHLRRFQELAAEHCAGSEAARTTHRYYAAMNAGDWDAVHACLAPGAELTDRHPPGSDGEQAGRWCFYVERVLAEDEEAVAHRLCGIGTSADGGDAEVSWHVLLRFRGGLIAGAELFGADDAALLGRFDAIRRRHTESERVLQRFVAAINERDWEALADTLDENWSRIDDRPQAWDPARGRDAGVQHYRSVVETVPDVQLAVDVIASSDEVLAGRSLWAGTTPDGGPAEIKVAVRLVARDGRCLFIETADAGDRVSELRRFEELRAEHAVARAARAVHRWIPAMEAGDHDAMRDAYDEDYVLIDHRALGWGRLDRDQMVATALGWRGPVVSPTASYTRTLAADDERFAGVMTGVGHSPDGGPIEMAIGQVALLRGDRLLRVEMFDPDDAEGMLACYEAMGRGTGVDPALVAVAERWAASVNDRDWDALRERYWPHVRLVDHRANGWGELHGADELVENHRAMDAVVDSWGVRVEVLAADGDPDGDYGLALLLHYGGRSGDAPFELSVGALIFARGGRREHVGILDPDDRVALLARYDELRRERLERPAPLRLYDAWTRAANARDWEAVRATLSDDFVVIDRRGLGWGEMRGRDVQIELLQGFVDAAPDAHAWVARVLATDEDAACVVLGGGGTDQQGGTFELAFGHVALFRDGRFDRLELFDPDDEQAMRAAYAQALEDRRLAATEIGRLHLRWVETFNARDWEGLRASFAEDFEQVDHRAVGWGRQLGPDAGLAVMRSWAETVPDAVVRRTELLALDERVVAMTLMGHASFAGGEIELGTGIVMVSEGGLTRRTEVFDPDDREAMLARFAELRATIVGASGAAAAIRGVVAAFNARDWDAVAALHAEEFVQVDHRSMGWEDWRGPDGAVQQLRAIIEVVDDARFTVLEVLAAADEVALTRLLCHGGDAESPFEVEVLNLNVARAGVEVHAELFDPADEAAARARFAALTRLRVEPCAGRDANIAWADAHNAHDPELVERLVADEYRLEDLRPLVRHTMDREQAVAGWKRSLASVPDLHLDLDFHAAADRVSFVTARWVGHGGSYEIVLDSVSVFDEHGRRLADYAYEAGDPAAVAMYESWVAQLRQARHFAELLTARDFDSLRELYAEDFSQADFRELGASEIVGGHAFVDHLAETFAPVRDLRAAVEVVAVDGDRRVGRVTYRGHSDEVHGVEFELQFWTVTTIDGLRFLRSDIYPSAQDARAALAGPRAPAPPA